MPQDAPRELGGPPYDPTTVWLHWITVALVGALWALGQITDGLPQAWRHPVWSVHVVLGIALAFVLLTRVAWRGQFGRVLAPADTGVLYGIATATHYALYALLFAVVATGLANASYRGFEVFGVWAVPQFGSGDRATRRAINGWHELAANAILAVSLAHAAAALVHQYVWRDQLMERMRIAPRQR